MEKAAILKSGIVVKLTDLINPIYTIYGFLNSFETIIDGVTKKFRETLINDLKEEDQLNKDAIGGFYEEQFFLEYLIDPNKLYQLKEHYYNFKLATDDDEIKVRKLKVVDPYTDFCKIETYKWNYKTNIPVVDFGTWQIKIPIGINPDPLEGENVQLTNTAMQFYSHKIALFVTPLTDTNEKQEKALLFAKIALRINSIILDLYKPLSLELNTDFANYLNNQILEWTNSPIFVNPTKETLEDYSRNLSNFYKSFYANQILIKNAPKEDKFYWLARVLSAEALATVPTIDKVILLEKISGFQQLLTESNGGESLVLKIVESFTFNSVSATDRNDFLDYLMQNQVYQVSFREKGSFDSHQTLFEVLYSKIDDNRTGRYKIGPLAFTFGLLDTKDNRKAFILMLYKIWKSSKYNPKYADPSYTLPQNIFGVYPESYYMKLITDVGNSTALTAYYDPETSPAVIVYNASSSSSTDSYMRVTGGDYIVGDFEGKKVKIHKKETTTTIDYYSTRENNQHINAYTSLYGTYDLYQPISIIGFKPDLDLVETFKNPETGITQEEDRFPNIPVFFLYYMQDYSDLKKIDFGVVLAAEVAMNLTGIGALNDLKYLGYLSKARSVWSGTATASETVLFWKAVEGVNNTVQFTADNLAAINSYANNTTIDPDVKEFTEKVSVLFDVITIGSLVTDPIMKRKLFDSAADVLAQESKLISLGKPHGLNADAMNAIRAIYDVESLIDLMQLKLNNLPSYANDKILTRFSTFTQEEKYAFFADFYNLKKEADWTVMNVQYARNVNGSPQQYTLVDIWKNEIQYLKNQRTFEILKSFNFVAYDTRNNRLREHVFEGHVYSSGNVGGFHHMEGNLNVNNYGRIDLVIDESDPLGYYVANISVKNPNTGNFISKGYYKKVGGVKTKFPIDNDMFPRQWTREELIENVAFAYKNKVSLGFKNQYLGSMSDGKKLILCIDNENTATEKIRTIWPKR
jgi:hypothetical protein